MTSRSTPPRHPRRAARLALGLLATFALLAACSGPVPGLQLGLGSASVALLRGGSVDVDVTVTRNGGATGAVALSVTGLPANVTASFAPAALDGAVVDSVLTLSASAAAIEAMPTLTVEATGASLTAEATLDLSIESLALDGRVVGLFGVPLAGVAVASQGETTFTDTDGGFELDGLATPYELVLSTAVGSGGVHVFEDLTTATPVLTPAFAIGGLGPAGESATVSGNVLGGAAIAADRNVMVCAEGLDLVAFGCDRAGPGDTAYSLSAVWFGPTTTSIRVHALHYETGVDDTPSAYLGYETFDLSLSDGDADARDLALAPVASVLVEGSLTAAAGLTIAETIGAVRFGPRLAMDLFVSTALAGDVSVLMPALTGATYDFATIGDGPSGLSLVWTVDQGTNFGTLAVQAPLTQGSPLDATLGVDLATSFTSSASDEVRTYFFQGPGPVLALTTTRTAVTMPDPALGGLAFPAGDAYNWYALGHGLTDADAALGRSLLDYYDLVVFLGLGGPSFDQDGVLTLGTPRGFTFAP